jgi:hypothetical protein
VADNNEGFAVGLMVDPEKFANQRIFYVVLICTTSASRGVGTRLMRVVEREARRLGCGRVWLASLPERTAIYKKWGYDFGPYIDARDDLLAALETGKRAARIASTVAPPLTPIRIRSRNGTLANQTHPRPSKFFTIKGVHDDTAPDEGYLMTKRLGT